MDTRGIALVVLGLLAATACSSEPSDSSGVPSMPFQPTAGAGIAGAAGAGTAGAGTAGTGIGTAGTGIGTAGTGTGTAGVGTAGATGTAGTGTAGTGTAGTGTAGTGTAGTGTAGMGTAGMGTAGVGTSGTGAPFEPPECELNEPAEFMPNPSVGGGGGQFTDSPHFRIYGATGSSAEAALDHLEAAYSCFVETLCWRSSGLSINDAQDDGPYYKMNVYSVGSLGGAGGVMSSNASAGAAFLQVVSSYLAQPRVTVHEYGHALTYYEKGWIEQTRTGAWWETVANFVADTYMTSPICADARSEFGIEEGDTVIELNKVINDAHQVIVDGSSGSGNYYQAWPFLTYLTNNPDGYTGLGATALRDMFREHERNNETPLHVLERVADPVSVQTIVGRYWARMAYLDIGHEQARERFFSMRGSLNFANLDAAGSGMYRVKAARQPRYFGANITPLDATGNVTVAVTSSGAFTATLSIRASSGSVRYVDLPGGSGQATLASGEEASLVVVNTPAALVQYDPFSLSGAVTSGLDYQVALTGATPAE
jgi:hypothetical protein